MGILSFFPIEILSFLKEILSFFPIEILSFFKEILSVYLNLKPAFLKLDTWSPLMRSRLFFLSVPRFMKAKDRKMDLFFEGSVHSQTEL